MGHAEPVSATGTAALASTMDPSGNAQPCVQGPESEGQAEGTVARLIRQGEWGRQRWPAGRCRTALRAAQLRLALGFLHSERLTARCPLELDADVSETIAACFRVTAPLPLLPSRGLALGL